MVSNIFLLFLGKFVFNMVERDFWFCFWNLILMFFILIWKFNREINCVSDIKILDIIIFFVYWWSFYFWFGNYYFNNIVFIGFNFVKGRK